MPDSPEKIDRWVCYETDCLDALLMSGKITQERYDEISREIGKEADRRYAVLEKLAQLTV